MAGEQVPIIRQGPAAAPVTYQLPATAPCMPVVVSADFDGSGAAGAFLPAVVLIDQTGTVIARALGQSVAAGASASVSFFPGGAETASVTPPTPGTSLSWASMFSDPAGTSISSGAATQFVSIHDTGGAAGFDTSDGTTFTNGSSTAFTGSAVYGIQIHAAGTYRVLNNIVWINSGAAGRVFNAYWAADLGSAPSHFQAGRTQNVTGENWDGGGVTFGPHLFTDEIMSVTSGQTPATLVRTVKLASGAAVTVTFQMIVVKLSDYVAVKI